VATLLSIIALFGGGRLGGAICYARPVCFGPRGAAQWVTVAYPNGYVDASGSLPGPGNVGRDGRYSPSREVNFLGAPYFHGEKPAS
jgi:hypothetical protein